MRSSVSKLPAGSTSVTNHWYHVSLTVKVHRGNVKSNVGRLHRAYTGRGGGITLQVLSSFDGPANGSANAFRSRAHVRVSRVVLSSYSVFWLSCFLAQTAKADFISPYPLSGFTLTNCGILAIYSFRRMTFRWPS